MKALSHIFIIAAITFSGTSLTFAQEQKKVEDPSYKKERNFVRAGNKLYNQKRYSEAEVEYKKALQVNPGSAVATYNLASALIKQGGGTPKKEGEADKNDPMVKAEQLLQNVIKTSSDKGLASRAFYNLGNMEFHREQYQKAIDLYKDCLRRNPDDDQARENLRLAQKKLEEQQQNQNQQQNQQNQQQQQQQQQDQQQNQNQNKDQNNDKDPNQQQNAPKKDQNQGGMSEDNIDQILKTMQNQENAVQQKVNEAKAKEKAAGSRRTTRQW